MQDGTILRHIEEIGQLKNKINHAKIYVGCGDHFKDDYIGCDIRQTKAAAVVCNAWDISHHFENAKEIYSRHMLEHLTFGEMRLCLSDWHKTLIRRGQINIIVPNIDFHIKRWLQAEWNDEAMNERTSAARWSSASFWGWQTECDPASDDYNNTYWDVHKSGYNFKSLTYFLKKAGFRNIRCEDSEYRQLDVFANK